MRISDISAEEGTRWVEERNALSAHLDLQRAAVTQLLAKHNWPSDYVTLPPSPQPIAASQVDEPVALDLAMSTTDAPDSASETVVSIQPISVAQEPVIDTKALLNQHRQLTDQVAELAAQSEAAVVAVEFVRCEQLDAELVESQSQLV
jgi:hypothetical protein